MTLVSLPGVPDVAQIDVLDLGGVSVPVVAMAMLDERTGCERAHRSLAGELDGVPADYTPGHFYHGATPRHSAAELSQADGARVVGWEVVPV